MIDNRLLHFVNPFPCVSKVHNLHIKLRIQKNILRFNITVRDLPGMGMFQGRNQLLEYVPGGLLWELLGLGDKSVKLPVLLDFHDIIQNSLHLAIRGTIDASHIKVDNLNYVSMFSLVRHLHLVQKLLKGLLLVATFGIALFYVLVHDLDGDSLVSN